ncbi:unnamed protein product [Adineta steineri]|uniref:Uncharacterized protein n=1 Tax=Adineta steineri TaxID=433720 RepID=A0A815A1K8_9BILA|nr:unnamed protein product [Adineta steineri]CAF1524732.1 unnamed protein product [Adineta steineri]
MNNSDWSGSWGSSWSGSWSGSWSVGLQAAQPRRPQGRQLIILQGSQPRRTQRAGQTARGSPLLIKWPVPSLGSAA